MGKSEIRQKILIVDDSEMNRSILSDMLQDKFEIIEAADGEEAVTILHTKRTEISLMLLDIVMPKMDGFDVLAVMNKYNMIDDIPVIMISAENASSCVERAYELGVTDYISRPFDAMIVHRRVINTIMLYAKQKKLITLASNQIYEKEKSSKLMISILSHIVEFRNGESGLHVLHISTMTELLLKQLMHKTDRYKLKHSDIGLISTASALHDIGKIAIPEDILNKPGKLTKEEFEIMKTHSALGAQMLDKLPYYQEEKLVKVAYEICRWHHERYDGKGYPDGLKGEEIPIAAQVVSLADVYDALTSERVYKPAFSHGKAMQMIQNGECGAFNPLLLKCLCEIGDVILKELKTNSLSDQSRKSLQNITEEILQYDELGASERTLRLLEHERTKSEFFASLSQEIQFEYVSDPPMVLVSGVDAQKLGIDEIIMNPKENEKLRRIFEGSMEGLAERLLLSTPESPIIEYDCELMINGEHRWNRFVCRSMWNYEKPPRMTGCIGKMVDIHKEHTKMKDLQHLAAHDGLTGLLNHTNVRLLIREKLSEYKNREYLMAIFDIDYFKDVNDKYGHMFGDKVLQYVAGNLLKAVQSEDFVARIGGDEFLIFMEYKEETGKKIETVFDRIAGNYQGFAVSISMGIARTNIVGREYETMFHCADRALYAAKRSGRGQYCFYEASMSDMLSVISSIDREEKE